MSDITKDYALKVPPIGCAKMLLFAEAFLTKMCPNALSEPTILQGGELVDFIDQEYKIPVVTVSEHHMDELCGENVEAATTLDGKVQILFRENMEKKLYWRGPRARRAKSTLLHELFHGRVHAKHAKRLRLQRKHLPRQRRSALKAFNDAEWQATTFAAFVMIPVSVLKKLPPDIHYKEVSILFNVSERMAQIHLERLRRKNMIF